MTQTRTDTPIYEARDIVKTYGTFTALNGVNFKIFAGEVVGLLGDNGAGKTTLIKMMSGVLDPTSGDTFVDGVQTDIRSREDSQNAGIETIYQDTALVDSMSIVRNVFLGRELTNRFGFMRHKEMRRIAHDVVSGAVHISGVDDPDKHVGLLSGGQKQAVAIARAMYFRRKILLLDEPTSALSVRETERLLDYIVEQKQEGISSVIVTHNIYHAFQICDRFVVMSHGQVRFEVAKQDTTVEELTRHVIMS